MHSPSFLYAACSSSVLFLIRCLLLPSSFPLSPKNGEQIIQPSCYQHLVEGSKPHHRRYRSYPITDTDRWNNEDVYLAQIEVGASTGLEHRARPNGKPVMIWTTSE